MLKRFFLLSLILFSSSIFANNQVFGIVAKSLDDANFIDTWKGCNDTALKNNDVCILIGEHGAAHPRLQAIAIHDALQNYQLAGLAISVTKSDYIAEQIKTTKVPVITFDSDFDDAYKSYRRSFVGMNNTEIGTNLGKIAKGFYPNGGEVCILTTVFHTNLNERMYAVRRTLSNDDNYPVTKRLDGENGWHECSRSPLNASGNVYKSLETVVYTLEKIKPDILISVGHWPIVDSSMYKERVKPYENQLVSGKTKLIVATSPVVLSSNHLLEEKLIHGYVSISFYKIGEAVYNKMKKISQGFPVEPAVYIDSETVIAK